MREESVGFWCIEFSRGVAVITASRTIFSDSYRTLCPLCVCVRLAIFFVVSQRHNHLIVSGVEFFLVFVIASKFFFVPFVFVARDTADTRFSISSKWNINFDKKTVFDLSALVLKIHSL